MIFCDSFCLDRYQYYAIFCIFEVNDIKIDWIQSVVSLYRMHETKFILYQGSREFLSVRRNFLVFIYKDKI